MKKALILIGAIILILGAIIIPAQVIKAQDVFTQSFTNFITLSSTKSFLKLTTTKPDNPSGCDGKAPGVSNPAAVYCNDLGYEYKTIDTSEGQKGNCIFPDKTQCDAWDFLQGKCGQEFSYCEQNNYKTITKNDGKNPYSQEYAVCINQKNNEIGSVVELTNLVDKTTKGILESKEIISNTIKTTLKLDLPTNFDWRNHNGENWVTSVKDQGICGSCWAFSAVGVVEAIHNIVEENPNLDLDLSEQYLVSDCHQDLDSQTCCGGYKHRALLLMKEQGIPDEECMNYIDGTGCSCSGDTCDSNCNYNTGNLCSDATCSDKCSDWENRLVTIKETAGVMENPEIIKQYLIEKGPLAVSMGVGPVIDGYTWDGDIYRCTNDEDINHAVVIIGYNNSGQYWIVKNSWGNTWNGDGYFKVGYNECAIEKYVRYADNSNRPPSIAYIGSQEVYMGNTLIINVDATDLDEDELTYYTNAGEVLPSSFSFNSQTGVFEWTPNSGEEGVYEIIFNVTDGELWDDEPSIITVQPTNLPVCGDANNDGEINVGDAVYLINYVFKGGPAPECETPSNCGDANGDDAVNVGDAVYIINYVFKGGLPPVEKSGTCTLP